MGKGAAAIFNTYKVLKKFFTGSMSKRDLAYLLFSHRCLENEILKDRSGGLHSELLLEMALSDRVERGEEGVVSNF